LDAFAEFLREKIGKEVLHWAPEQMASDEGPFLSRLPREGTVLALAPHASDVERSAIFLWRLKDRGWTVRSAICTRGVTGVLDRYAKARGGTGDLARRKAEIRREEAKASAKLMGLTEDATIFLYDAHGDVGRGEPERDARIIAGVLAEIRPDIVVLPSGNDENASHVGVFQALRAAAATRPTGRPLVAFYHEDPKTLGLTPDLLVWFTRRESLFKARLLATHDSQQQRRYERTGEGLDDKVLRCNFERASSFRKTRRDAPEHPFAEAFEIEVFGL
jgi:LmbE family N-acetylglucosaminyl deacetylase